MGYGTGILIQINDETRVNGMKLNSFLTIPGTTGFYDYFQRLGKRESRSHVNMVQIL